MATLPIPLPVLLPDSAQLDVESLNFTDEAIVMIAGASETLRCVHFAVSARVMSIASMAEPSVIFPGSVCAAAYLCERVASTADQETVVAKSSLSGSQTLPCPMVANESPW